MILRRHSCRSLPFSTISWALKSLASNSFPITLFSDPHPLNHTVSISYKTGGGEGVEAVKRPCANPFKINTCTAVRKCCKQRTYAQAKPSGCSTYKKHEGGWGVVMVNQKSPREPVAHPFRGEVSACRPACRNLLSACGCCRRASFQSVPPSRSANAPPPNRSWRRTRGQSERAYHCSTYSWNHCALRRQACVCRPSR